MPMNAHSPAPTPPKAVIFDLDGVIFDSGESNIAYYDHILAALGLPPQARQAFHVIHAEPTDRSLLYLLGDGPQYQEAMRYARGMDPSPFVQALTLNPGVLETLARLKGRARLSVATNRTASCRMALERFDLLGFFEQVVTPWDAGQSKPHPAMMHLTLERLGLEPGQVVYVGDTGVDEGMCKASQVRLVAFGNQKLEAWAHTDDFTALPGLLGLE